MWYSSRFEICFIVIIAFSVFPLSSLSAASDMEHTVDELPYGVALYDFFQDKYYSSITDILVAQKNQTLVDQNKTAELLLGGLYLSYGLQDRAHEIFKTITLNKSQDVPQNVLDQAFFQIGKDYFRGGLEDQSKQALLTIGNGQRSTLSPVYESERLNILSDIYMHDHQYDDVVQLLKLFPEKSIWKEYTLFNLGASLVKNNRINEGIQLLKSLAELKPSNKELDILHDQANLALAATYAKLDNPDLSIKYLENIKMSNPQSGSALLGLGWIKFKTASYDDALSAWSELASFSKSDTDVQEALLLIPYALEKHDEKAKAMRAYDFAIATYAQQLKNIESIKEDINQGEITRILKASAASQGNPDSDDMIRMMGPKMSEYLSGLITSSDFRQAVIRYRELVVLERSLSQWEQAIPSMNLILDEKINAYNDRLAVVINSPKLEYAAKLHDKRKKLVEQFDKAMSIDATRALANKDEKKLFSMLDQVKSGLDSISGEYAKPPELRAKYRFLSGLLKWTIDTDYAPRLWAAKAGINELDKELQGMDSAIESLNSIWKEAPAEHIKLREMIRGKKERIAALMHDVRREMAAQETRVQIMAEGAIEQYRSRLKKYHDRALFSKARVYDSMVLKN